MIGLHLKQPHNFSFRVRKLLFELIAVITLTVAPITKSSAFDFERPVDRGGRIGDYVVRIVAEAAKRHVIDGDCMSACTLWLGHRGTCVTPNAVLWFHAATEFPQTVSERRPWRSISLAGNRALLAMYPARLRAIVSPWLESSEFHTLNGLQLASLGVPLCPSDNVTGNLGPHPLRIYGSVAMLR